MAFIWKTVRVFISSTFLDMQAERDWLVRFVFPRLSEELLSRQIHFVDVDLRWGVTSDDTLGACLQIIDECRPLFMCVLGGRYGSPRGARGLSITAEEIEHRLHLQPSTLKSVFFYFRAPLATAAMTEGFPGEFRDATGSGNAAKLASLKKSIQDAGWQPVIYHPRWDAEKERLVGLEEFGNRVYADLFEGIRNDPAFADRFAAGLALPSRTEFVAEDDAMVTFIAERVERYVIGSRQLLFDRLIAFASDYGAPNIFVICGTAGTGKSALLANLHQSLAAADTGLLISHFIGASIGSTDLRSMLRRLCQALDPDALVSDEVTELCEQLRERIAAAAETRRVILILDGLNQLDAADGAPLMHWLPRHLPPNVRLIVSSLEHPALAALRDSGPLVQLETLAELTEIDVRQIIEGVLRRFHKALAPAAVAALLRKADSRLPLYILTALTELRTLGTHEDILARIEALPGDTRAVFVWILQTRLASDPGFLNSHGQQCGAELVESFARCLGASRHGLSRTELIGLLDVGDPLGNVAALLRLLRPYLMFRGELLDFFHDQFREAVRSEFLHTAARRRAAHQTLASFFQDSANPGRSGRWDGNSPHALSELPYHQGNASAWGDLIATLEDILFLEAKAAAGMTYGLLADLGEAAARLPPAYEARERFRLLGAALRQDASFVARHPATLFQCFWNTCWWFDSPAAAAHYLQPAAGWLHAPPWERCGPKLCDLLEAWSNRLAGVDLSRRWVRSLRPLAGHIGSAQEMVLQSSQAGITELLILNSGRDGIAAHTDGNLTHWQFDAGVSQIWAAHSECITGLALANGGKHLISTAGKVMRVWQLPDFSLLQTVFEHDAELTSVATTPDGVFVQVADHTGWIHVFLMHSGTSTWSKVDQFWHRKLPIRALVSAGNAVMFASGADSGISHADGPGAFMVFSTDGNMRRGAETTSGIRGIALSWDGTLLAFATANGRLQVREWMSRRGLFEDFAHDWPLRAELGSGSNTIALGETDLLDRIGMGFSPDGKWLAMGSWDRSLRVWEVESGQLIRHFKGHTKNVTVCRFGPDGDRLFSGSEDGTIRVWRFDLDDFELEEHSDWIQAIAFSPDGTRIVTGGTSSVMLWDAISGTCLKKLSDQMLPVEKVGFSEDGQRVLCVDATDRVSIWQLSDGQMTWQGSQRAKPEWVDSSGSKIGPRWQTGLRWNPFSDEEPVQYSVAGVPLKVGYNEFIRQAVSPDGKVCAFSQGSQLAIYRVESFVRVC